MTNEELYDAASEAIKAVFVDKSVEIHQTISNLEALQDECEDYINALEEQENI